MPACPRETSLRIGKRTTFKRVENNKIPHHYYSFATYDDLPMREQSKMLTDYIGRIEDNKVRSTRKGQILKKIWIRDESGHLMEMTFRPKQQTLLPRIIRNEDIWALTGIMVKDYLTTLQLESTPATTIEINPTTPDAAGHVERLRNLTSAAMEPAINLQTVAQINNKTPEELASQDNTDKMHAIFFDEAMTEMLGISCEKMITIYGEDDPHEIPQKIMETINRYKLMSMTVKSNQTAAINSVTDYQQPPETGPLALPPTTNEQQPASQTVKAPATPAKRLAGQDKAKQA